MAIGTTNIKMYDIAAELQAGTTDIEMYNTLYGSSQAAWNLRAGSYHNWNNMALPGLADNFRSAIESKYSGFLDMGIKNWAGYDHDHNVMLNIRINNGNIFNDVQVKLYICDQPNGPGGGGTSINIFNGTVPMNNAANVTINNYDTGVAAFSNYAGTGFAGYWIWGNIVITPLPGVARPTLLSFTANDTDGVGDINSCIRLDYTANGSPGGIWDLYLAGAFNDNIFAGDQGGGWPNDAISWNKRTTFLVDIA